METDEASSRSGAVAAVVGLLFLLFVTALARRRRAGTPVDDVVVDEPASARPEA
ncbi:hypothetical protein [Halomarina oriensis]|uniref:Uncharacterized protein n=1 Tax=Halomarina oriensis TaxID=671145 RepID=A0A6B0GND4_9EURY|nr:hypothetical protein [Halomarina oriensis]MWG36190.1 hypothetical protein [Halomarina oriensis]